MEEIDIHVPEYFLRVTSCSGTFPFSQRHNVTALLLLSINCHVALPFEFYLFFYICSYVHHNSRLKKSNKMQQYADIYLLLNFSTCFGRPSLLSSGVHKTVVTASGTHHTIWEATVLCTPDDGCDRRPKHVEKFSSK